MIAKEKIKTAQQIFEKVYAEYHHRKYTVNDPVHWLYSFPDKGDKEVVGLISALLAFGNAKAFNNKIAWILSLWRFPSKELMNWSRNDFVSTLIDFRHRFVSGIVMAHLLYGIRRIIEEHRSIGSCFYKHYKKSSGNLWHTIDNFTDELRKSADCSLNFLLPIPKKGGACKRVWLYLRWMVRKDEIDVGCWKFLKQEQLIVPLDTHVYQWAVALRLISPCSLNAKTAIYLTEVFRHINPDDPLRYDFSLCQAGMLGMRDKIIYDERKKE